MKTTHDDKTFTLIGRYWLVSYPIEELGEQREFYRRQREKFPKPGTSCDATIAELEKLAEEIEA
ncbi:hypothetical protein [Paracoccus alkanivorans]|uniref:Uncharacterized protein n=1 Tax=Paracoccus alkanivorans TaxID=2116655 RepID=A0A3M0MAV0_9RHOB|nr:hypothetical protein [Paracoccus alkanivorans]RMC34435.1 hypothetical protein C9E81_14965 [Paracoccus alkanivorans]